MSPSAENLDVRPLILGSGGLVGRVLGDELEQRFPHLISATRAEIDITDRWRLEAEIERLEPTVLISCAAVSDVDACERDPEKARRINAEAPAMLAQAARSAGLRLVQISTDYVFDGAKDREYDESDAPNPVNEYGRSKLEGELAVLETLVEAVVLRVSFVFGPGRETFIDKIARQAVAGSAAIPVVDAWRSRPTYAREIARALVNILESEVTGVWHFANPVAGTRFAFARRVVELLGEDPARVVPFDAGALELAARRPASTPLSTTRYEARFGEAPRDWLDCAREYFQLNPPWEGQR